MVQLKHLAGALVLIATVTTLAMVFRVRGSSHTRPITLRHPELETTATAVTEPEPIKFDTPCDKNRCLHGTCKELGATDYSCECFPGYAVWHPDEDADADDDDAAADPEAEALAKELEELENMLKGSRSGSVFNDTVLGEIQEQIDDLKKAQAEAAALRDEPHWFRPRNAKGLAGPGGLCVDVDECRSETSSCSGEELCVNTDGSFMCVAECPEGHRSRGQRCLDIDECSENSHDCFAGLYVRGFDSKSAAPCTNTKGGFECGDCPKYLVGDGKTCKRPVERVKKELDESYEIIAERLRGPLDAVATFEYLDENEVILIFGDATYANVMMNCIVSLNRHDQRNYVVVAFDNEVEKRLEGLSVPVVNMADLFDPKAGRTKTWAIFTFRMVVLRQIVKMGYSVFHLDADVLWRRNIYEILDMHLFKLESLSATFPGNMKTEFGGTVNGGFFRIANTPEMVEVLDYAFAVNEGAQDDQKALNYALYELGLKFKTVVNCQDAEGSCPTSTNKYDYATRLMNPNLVTTAPRTVSAFKNKQIMPAAIHACATKKTGVFKEGWMKLNHAWILSDDWESCRGMEGKELDACLDNGLALPLEFPPALDNAAKDECIKQPTVVVYAQGTDAGYLSKVLGSVFHPGDVSRGASESKAMPKKLDKLVSKILEKTGGVDFSLESLSEDDRAFMVDSVSGAMKDVISTWRASRPLWCDMFFQSSAAAFVLPILKEQYPGLRVIHVVQDLRVPAGVAAAAAPDLLRKTKAAGQAIVKAKGLDVDQNDLMALFGVVWAEVNAGVKTWAEREIPDGYTIIRLEDLCEDKFSPLDNMFKNYGVYETVPEYMYPVRPDWIAQSMWREYDTGKQLNKKIKALGKTAEDRRFACVGLSLESEQLEEVDKATAVATDALEMMGYTKNGPFVPPAAPSFFRGLFG